jgi:flagellar assembly protein FliH
MNSVIRNNQASNAYQKLAFDQFDAPPPLPQPVEPEVPVEAASSSLEIAPGVSLPTLEDVERIHQDAQQEGYAAGYEEGTARGRLEAAELHQLVQSLDTAMSTLDQEIAEEIQTLAIEIARQVVRETLSTRPESILTVIREALQSLPQQSAVIHINPEDMQLVKRYMEEHFSSIDQRVVEDTNVLRGGCVIESSGGQIDAQVQTRWRRVVENLTHNAKDFLDE